MKNGLILLLLGAAAMHEARVYQPVPCLSRPGTVVVTRPIRTPPIPCVPVFPLPILAPRF